MEKKKHTKGPWFASEPKVSEVTDGQTYFSIGSRKPERRGDTYVMPGFFYPHSVQTPEEMEANAKLIAAAPELLEALESLKIFYEQWLQYDGGTIGHRAAKKALAAIDKATK